MARVLKNLNWMPEPPNLLVSARSAIEAEWVIESGAKWLDLKEPEHGSLGRPKLETILELTRMEIASDVHISVAGGELAEWPFELDESLAAILPLRFHLKLALANCNGKKWQETAERISRSLKHPSQLILVHYADTTEACSPDWTDVIEAARSLECRYVLIDTHNKRTGGLLDHRSIDQLQESIQLAHDVGLSVALAGSLKLNQLELLTHLGAEWLGVRGALCQTNERTSSLCRDKLTKALSLFSTYSRNESQ